MKCLKKDFCILWIMTFTKIREQRREHSPRTYTHGIHRAHFRDTQISVYCSREECRQSDLAEGSAEMMTPEDCRNLTLETVSF